MPELLLSAMAGPPAAEGSVNGLSKAERGGDAGATFVLADLVARRLPPDDGDRRADDPHTSLRLQGNGMGLGLVSLTGVAVVTFYSYFLMVKVLDHCEQQGRRHIRFRELAADVLGAGWMLYFVVFVQAAVNTGVAIGCILLSGRLSRYALIFSSLHPDSSLKLYQFIGMVTVVMILLSQLPSFHSLRYINLGSLLLSLGYTSLVVAGSIMAGYSGKAPRKDFSLDDSKSTRTFNIFTSISILASIFGNGILPEIQATVAPPATGKMVKGLTLCYTVIVITFYPTAVSGYWAFGNKVNSNVLKTLMPDEGPSLAPTWLLGLAAVFVLLQLFSIGLVYSQVAYEIMEKKSADPGRGKFSKRNLIPRLIPAIIVHDRLRVRGGYAAVLWRHQRRRRSRRLHTPGLRSPHAPVQHGPKASRASGVYWVNVSIMVVFTCTGIMGAFSSIRKLVLDAHKFKLFSNDVVD
ncbi:unnamed protein product [Spirodela intermedia]|uniref:Amino acid transporter transmembrane domain-containing protein n=1 Tax=Spirodela intermedia TaxID=51605 RepID=A0A7I8J773_SPIIN|nr:unnamed protein product [Spirodela intermedia]CAA6665880.1 unnamed protein product [Spirodela intermedia]